MPPLCAVDQAANDCAKSPGAVDTFGLPQYERVFLRRGIAKLTAGGTSLG